MSQRRLKANQGELERLESWDTGKAFEALKVPGATLMPVIAENNLDNELLEDDNVS